MLRQTCVVCNGSGKPGAGPRRGEGRRTLSTAVLARLTAGLLIHWCTLLTHRRASLALEAPIARPWIRLTRKVNRADPSEGQQLPPFRWETFQHARADPDISKSWLGRDLLRATTLPNGRRRYWLAPRSDDAVGAGLLGRHAGEVAARDDKPIRLLLGNAGLP